MIDPYSPFAERVTDVDDEPTIESLDPLEPWERARLEEVDRGEDYREYAVDLGDVD